MSDETFDVIMSQLSDLEFNGTLQLFYLGEPLLDSDIVERTRLARQACPKAKLLITSNGDLLKQVEQIDELFDAGLNVLNVDCYDEKVYDRALDLAVNCSFDVEIEYDKVRWKSSSVRSKIMTVVDFSKLESHYHRCHSYLIPEMERILKENGMLVSKKQKWCAQPHRRLVIWWDGTIVLCCVVTPLMKNPPIVGSYTNVLDAWNSLTMSQYRYQLQEGEKQDVCIDCYHRGAFPHVVRRITRPPFRRK